MTKVTPLNPNLPISLHHSSRAVHLWLIAICGLVTTMVSIGGMTRLTGSGLSITDWAPIMGAIPPLSEEAWQAAFQKYQQIPQYKLVNAGIPLSEFKFLFFWEWFHRLVGRLIGIVVLLPGIYFWIRGLISKALARRVLLGFFLGGLQGALGWFMVMSGLSERTSVSHFRLAAHLSLALLILSYFVWLTRSVIVGTARKNAEPESFAFLRPKYGALVALFSLQIIYGAFVAGLKAGHAFNTFPLMAGSWIPSNLFEFSPLWINFLENPAMVQWIHRTLGWAAFFSTLAVWITLARRGVPRGPLRKTATGLAHMVFLQFTLGVFTLIYAVPVALGVLHQLGAALIVILLTLLGHALNNAKHPA